MATRVCPDPGCPKLMKRGVPSSNLLHIAQPSIVAAFKPSSRFGGSSTRLSEKPSKRRTLSCDTEPVGGGDDVVTVFAWPTSLPSWPAGEESRPGLAGSEKFHKPTRLVS